MPVTVQTHLRRRGQPRRPHPRGPVITVKMRRQDAFYVVGTLLGDEAAFEERVRDRAVSENRLVSEDEKRELEETHDITERVKSNIHKAVARSR